MSESSVSSRIVNNTPGADIVTTTNATITTVTTISPSNVVAIKKEIEDDREIVILKMLDSRQSQSLDLKHQSQSRR